MANQISPTPEEFAARLVVNRKAWDAGEIDFKKFRERQRAIWEAVKKAGLREPVEALWRGDLFRPQPVRLHEMKEIE